MAAETLLQVQIRFETGNAPKGEFDSLTFCRGSFSRTCVAALPGSP
jgi:hypothetical protein